MQAPRTISSDSLNRFQLGHKRSFSFKSIFQDQGAVLKDAADKDPQNTEAQIKLLEYWLARGSLQKEALSDLVLKYEGDTHLFDDASAAASSPVAHNLLKNKKAWDIYLQALVQVPDEADVSPSEKVESATARREAILKGEDFVEPQMTSTTPASASAEVTAPELSSAQIATAALSRGGSHNVKIINNPDATPQADHPSTTANTSGASSAKTAYSGSSGKAAGSAAGAAGKAEPIRVIVEEARGNLFFRAVRFILVVAIYSFVSLTLISLVIDGSGLMRAGTNRSPVQEFQPQGQEKPVTFADGKLPLFYKSYASD